jgi:hypothetical protein
MDLGNFGGLFMHRGGRDGHGSYMGQRVAHEPRSQQGFGSDYVMNDLILVHVGLLWEN